MMEQLKIYQMSFVNVKQPFINLISVDKLNDSRAQNVFDSGVEDPSRKP